MSLIGIYNGGKRMNWKWYDADYYFDPYVKLETPILNYYFKSVKINYEIRNDISYSRHKLGFVN
jgi:hypothetical protein